MVRPRPPFGARGAFLPLDLTATPVDALVPLVNQFDLVVQCAGPFRTLPPTLLAAAICARVNYVDICDDKTATRHRLGLDDAAKAAGITALIDTGTFPGIDNVLVAAALARLPDADTVHLNFVCAGSGDGGFGVLQTTFLAVSRPFEQKVDGRWVSTPSYRGRTLVDFGPPLGRRAVYDFEVPELWSLPHAFPQLTTCTSKFGTIPELWNRATQALAVMPDPWRTDPVFLDGIAARALAPVHFLDRWVGAAWASTSTCAPPTDAAFTWTFTPHPRAQRSAGPRASPSMVLDGTISAPGVLLPETHIPPGAYCRQLESRGGILTWS
ncbi:MAG: saccharopine dehydrogenase NADP-binding domain-containing protein [Caldilineaceae bacterium]|nr:saccharopine dehydrogenase NADP-binding domain-containing protein [Caldilineaceae bacterium]